MHDEENRLNTFCLGESGAGSRKRAGVFALGGSARSSGGGGEDRTGQPESDG